MVKKVIWPPTAQKQLAKAYEFVLSRSYQNAEKLRQDILVYTRRLLTNPEMHPSDKYRKNNDGSYRAYEVHSYRKAYRVTSEEIIIVRVRHTSMEPRRY